jgi:hypothetical protein
MGGNETFRTAQDTDRTRGFVNKLMNLQVPGKYLELHERVRKY